MRIFKIISIMVFSIILFVTAGFFILSYLKPKPAGIFIDTTPVSSVYINRDLVGKTPFRGTYKAGNIKIKLVSDIADQNLIPYETNIILTSGIQTVVRREFAKTEETSSGDIISFEKETGRNTGLIAISTPDNAQISIDGVPRGFAPYKTSTISPAKHQITIKTPGYNDRTIIVETHQGFRLTVFAKLAKLPDIVQDQASPAATPVPVIKTFVQILDTPTGFLRVRTEPGTKGEEIAEVKPGSKYPYLDTDTETGWFKIQYEEAKPGLPNGIVGWISNQFAIKSP